MKRFYVAVLLCTLAILSCQKEPAVVSVTNVTLNMSSVEITEGETASITATISPDNADNKKVLWTSSDASVATVSNGTVTAVKPGTATITATSDDGGKTATCVITVKEKTYAVTGVSLDKTTLTLTEGDSQTLNATVSPSNATNKKVLWTSSDASVATVSNGTVTAVKPGTATITATSDDGGKTATCAVTVNAKIYPVESVSLNKSSLTMTEGDNTQLTATIKPENASNKNVSWKSSNTGVAKVTSDGKVTAVKAGTTTITVTTEDGGKTATCSVTVKAKAIPVTGVSLDKTTLTLTEGDSQTLNATVSPSNATNKNVSWKSSNTSVATVSSGGKVTAVKPGTATITATSDDGGKTASCVVTVTSQSEYVDLGLSVKWATCNLGATKPEGYGLYYQWGDTKGYGSGTSDGKYFFWNDGAGNVTYKWCNGSYHSLTKYNTISSYGTVDNKTVLDMEDDAARAALGGNWRMPTDAEWTELRENCTWTWTSNYNDTGVAGMIVTSKKSGYTNKSIFLPAAGCRSGGYLDDAGSYGYYWSSSLHTGLPDYAWVVYFGSDGVGRSGSYRCLGQPVRPVSD